MPSEYKTCLDCGKEFEYTERDQIFYAERNFNPPKRCKLCRIKNKARANHPTYPAPQQRREREDSEEFGY